MWRESAIAVRVSSTVVKTSWISPFLSMSTMCGRPSLTLLTARTGRAAPAIAPPRRAARRDELEAERRELAGDRHRAWLVAVADRDAHGAARRQARAGAE